jgi:hypothetical protein
MMRGEGKPLSLDARGRETYERSELVAAGEGGVASPPPLQELLGNTFPSQLFPLPQGARSPSL